MLSVPDAELKWVEIAIPLEDGVKKFTWDAWEVMTVQLEDGSIFRSDDQGETWHYITRMDRLRSWWCRTWLSLCQIAGRMRL